MEFNQPLGRTWRNWRHDLAIDDASVLRHAVWQALLIQGFFLRIRTDCDPACAAPVIEEETVLVDSRTKGSLTPVVSPARRILLYDRAVCEKCVSAWDRDGQ